MSLGSKHLLLISLVFIHFMFFSISGFPLTIAPLAIIVFITLHFYITFNTQKICLLFILFFWPILVVLIYSSFIKPIEIIGFTTTYLLWLFTSLTLAMGSVCYLRKVTSYRNVYTFVLVIIVSFSVAQVLLLRFFDSPVLYNPFGKFTYFTQYNLEKIYGITGPRAYGLFLEPSFNAFMIFFLTSAILLEKPHKSNRLVYIIGFIGIVFTASASGILLLFMLFILLSSLRFVSNNILRMAFLIGIPLLLIGFIPEALLSRLNEINVEGTSGYWRLVAPLRIISEAFSTLPIGLPFGQINDFVFSLGIDHGGITGSSIDNGLAVLFFYFGLLAFVFFLVISYKLISALYSRNKEGVIFWWYIIASLQFSGGVFLPEFVLPMVLIIYQYKKSKHIKKSISGNSN